MKKRPLQNKHIIFLTLGALVVRLLIGALYYNPVDIIPFNLDWALQMQEGFFNCYSHISSLDYPPLFPALLFLLSHPLSFAYANSMQALLMLLLKIIPILFDVGSIVVIYASLQKESKKFALTASIVWALNISVIFNASCWGQTDAMLLFFILLTFLMFAKKRPISALIFFALGCLTKLQMCYLAPVVLFELLFYYSPNKWIKALLAGLATGLLGWLPFMIGSKQLMLAPSIYLSGFGSYPYINLNAFNLYGLSPSLNFSDASQPFLGTVSYQTLSSCITVLILLGLFFFYVWMRVSARKIPACIPATLYMNAIFLFTTQMHERYQLPVLMLLFLCWILCRERIYLIFYFIIMTITFVNQAWVLFSYNYGEIFENWLPTVQQCFSLINCVVFVIMLYLILQKTILPKKQEYPS